MSKNKSCFAGFFACGGSRKRQDSDPPQCDLREAFVIVREQICEAAESVEDAALRMARVNRHRRLISCLNSACMYVTIKDN